MTISYVSSVPPALNPSHYFGPKAPLVKPDRIQNALIANLTVSLDDVKDSTDALDNRDLVRQYDAQIGDHLERRLLFFWHQLLACFGTRLHFEVGFTMDQAQSAKALKVKFAGHAAQSVTRNAAHSSTFPSLFACSNEDWENYQNGIAGEPEMFSFLRGSDLYNLSNATISMIRAINDADIQIDGAHHDSAFSNCALGLLNKAAKGEISPDSALPLFINSAIRITIARLKDDSVSEGVNEALKIYLAKFRELKSRLDTNPDWVYENLDMYNIKDKSARMKAMVLKIRSQAIRNNMMGQSEMAEKIAICKDKVFKKLAFTKKPDCIDEAFKYTLVDAFTNDLDKVRMKKFFALPPIAYNAKLRGRVTKLEKAKTALQPQIKRIKFLADELSTHMYKMRVKEIQSRGDTLRALRSAKKLRQKDLGELIRKKYPHEASSQPTISRSETGERTITLDFAKKLNAVFDVPAGLLLPQFFNT